MKIILFLISMLLPTMAGYALLYREGTLSGIEKLVFSFTLGTGLLSFYLFGLLRLNIPFSVLSVSPFFLPFLIAGAARWKEIKSTIGFSLRSPLSGLSLNQKIVFSLLGALIAWELLFVLFMIFSGPTEFWDAVTLWNYKAKIIYYGSGAGMGHGGQGIMQGEYRHYPLNLPIIRAWIAIFIGQWDDGFVNLHSLLLFICLLVLEYEFLKKTAGKMPAVILTFILSCLPVLVYNVLSGYADMSVGYYFMAAAIMLFYWHRNGSSRFLIYSGMLASVAMFTKNEGTAIVFPALFLTFVFHLFSARPSGRYAAGSIGLFLLSAVAILLWLRESGALSAIITISGVRESFFTFHSEGLMPLINHLFVFRTYNLFWFGIVFLFGLKWKKALRPDARFFLIPSVLSFFAVLYVFLFTPNIEWLIEGTTINRAMLVVIPLLTLTSGFLLAPENISGIQPDQDE